jgi:hypothetical protein
MRDGDELGGVVPGECPVGLTLMDDEEVGDVGFDP